MMLALDQHPVVHRKAWGFALLAKALGMRVVPPTVVRRVSTGELGELLANDAEARAYMSAHASVLNDGTIDALVMAPSRGSGQTAWRTISRREIIFTELLEARAWERAVASIEPLPNENKALLRDYVEVLALDYLACNVMRRGVLLDEGDSELLLVDNEGAFPPKNFAHAEAQLLERLKPIVRFPRGMLDALMRFDRERARETFMAGTFDAWILSPRTLMLLDERRLALLSLIAARVEEYGRDVVLSL